MDLREELIDIAGELEKLVTQGQEPHIQEPLNQLKRTAEEVGKAWSLSWIGYQANVYYRNFQPPPPGAHFSKEWGLQPTAFVPDSTTGDWVEYDPEQVRKLISQRAGNPNINPAEEFKATANAAIDKHKPTLVSIIEIALGNYQSQFLTAQIEATAKLKSISIRGFFDIWKPERGFSRDSTAIHQGTWMPPHAEILAKVASIQKTIDVISDLKEIAIQAASHIQRQVQHQRLTPNSQSQGTRIFIGHGHSHIWRELKDFLEDDLGLLVDEFNRISPAGVPTIGRLKTMLNSAMFAFLVMTGEDEQPGGDVRARENVVHEAGLFEGHLGFEKAIVLLEEGCKEFSNIHGLGHISFPKDNIRAAFQDIREVLEREGILTK